MAVLVHFTGDDLARTHVAATMGPLAETMWALSMLRCPLPVPAALSGWRDRVRSRRASRMRDLEALVPAGDLGVDLYSRTGESATIEKGIAGLLALPPELMRTEISEVARRHRLPASVWAAAEADSNARLRLADSIHSCYSSLVEPYWPGIHAHLQAERTARGRIMMHGGIDLLLSTLQPRLMRWHPPVLEVDCAGQAEVELGGHGLTLVPSLFIGTHPVVMIDQQAAGRQRVRLVFPALPGPSAPVNLWDSGRPAGKALTVVIGRTRTVILCSVGNGCTTSELATRARISVSAASQHATALRGAGLITTRRNGTAVLHTLTPLVPHQATFALSTMRRSRSS